MTGPQRGRWRVCLFILCLCGALATLGLCPELIAQEPAILLPPPANELPSSALQVLADVAHRAKLEDGSEVSILRGNARVVTADSSYSAKQAVVWESVIEQRRLLEIYLEDDVRIESPAGSQQLTQTYVQVWSDQTVNYQARWLREYQQPLTDPLLQRANLKRRAFAQQSNRGTSLVDWPSDSLPLRSISLEPTNTVLRRIRITSRTGQPFSARTERSNSSTPAEQVAVLSGGIKVNVDSPTPDGHPDPKAVELAADSVVVWTEPTEIENFTQMGERFQTRDTPLQIYLEGNIVVRQGDTLLKAQKAFFDAREDRALLIDAEVKLTLPGASAPLRIRAQRIRQLSRESFHAQQAWLSGSYFGKPGYRLESQDIFYEPRVVNPVVHAQGGWTNPVTGEFDDGVIDWVTAVGNTFYIQDVPVSYLPYISSPAENPHLPLTKVTGRSDNIFGLSLQTVWNPYHLFGQDNPDGLNPGLLIDYYTKRGPGLGYEGTYQGSDYFGRGDKHRGEFLGYYLHDDGADILGADRRKLAPPDQNRGRLFWRHRHEFPEDFFLTAEIGYLSDRNFLEQWYENEFDRDKDNETLLYGQHQFDTNAAWSVLGRVQLNDFENNTQWLPKGDAYVLGQPLLDGWLTWTMHSSAGYGSFVRGDAPIDPRDLYSPIPYQVPAEGLVGMSRHELTLPLNIGPVVFSPYVQGEVAHWSNDATGNDLDRVVGTAGVRGSLTMWRAFPYVRNRVFNLTGLAHKMVFDVDFSHTSASEALGRVAQYNEFDDDAQERFRQRLLVNTFGGVLPPAFDARSYAVRSGAGSLISVPYHELVDNLNVMRLGWRHRLQTKVGAPGQERIVDWMTLDLEASYFPRPDQQNFGEDFGLLGARYSWLLGQRTTFLAGALYDTFAGGQQLWHAGIVTQRPERGSIYLGVRQIHGGNGLDSTILTASASYLLNPKWIVTGSTAYDLSEHQNRGQSLTLTRAGADWLFHLGGSFDPSKDSYGATLSFEPRFGPRDLNSTQFSSLLGTTR